MQHSFVRGLTSGLTLSVGLQTLVLAPRFLDELRKLPDATVSLEAAVRDVRVVWGSCDVKPLMYA